MQQVANFGFPIVVSIYLLVRVEGRLEHLSCSINDLSSVILRLKEVIVHE
ncbi:YvrJ protein family protein [Desulfonispora thiosulfatigenes DSM 11270]|uniref:YvrJ protein family protein n=2 Tax=Desulfonispora thiosulfatigenes TaxID=83661 RepID=A0A1W1V5F4_DESTI|nr:YvrJ protein family protein [Desulfonispora thiosulfatigenes DSM 11270]